MRIPPDYYVTLTRKWVKVSVSRADSVVVRGDGRGLEYRSQLRTSVFVVGVSYTVEKRKLAWS